MGKTIRTILAVLLGLAVGSAVNMGLILLRPMVIPPPAGVDVTDMESLAASMHLFQFRHFVFPFLAHAAGALVAAYLAVMIASGYRLKLSMLVGSLFLLGGISNCHIAARARLVYRGGFGRRLYTHGLDRRSADGQGIRRAIPNGKPAWYRMQTNPSWPCLREAIRALVEAGTDPNARDHEGRTPLDQAESARSRTAARALVELGA